MGVTVPDGSICYLDTVALIICVERVGALWPRVKPIWERVAAKQIAFRTSEITLLEVLVGPLKTNNAVLAAAYERVLSSGAVTMAPVTREALRAAAALRAQHGLKFADAIHAASSVQMGCSVFLSQDADFKRVPGLPLVMLSEL